MRSQDRDRAQRLNEGLSYYNQHIRHLPGIQQIESQDALIEQLLESIRRVKYVSVIRKRELSPRREDPDDEMFDPLKAAIIHQERGNLDESFWLVFLFVHFGKNRRAGWRYAQEIYGRLGEGVRWDWIEVSADPPGFRAWLDANQGHLKREGVPRGFGNHRKFQSLDAYSPNGTGDAVESYVEWVDPPRTHKQVIGQAIDEAVGDPHRAFDILYRSMEAVKTFGRLARFDYLTMIGKLSLAPIEPGSAYIGNSTGPRLGARLLFGGSKDARIGARDLNDWLIELDSHINVGMQVIEDGLCNWQKSPSRFIPVRG